MDAERRKEYQTACRNAAAAILLSQTDLQTEVAALAQRYRIEPTLVSQDIDMLIQSERQKVSGVFKFDGSSPKRSTNDD